MPSKVSLTNGVTCEIVGVARNPRNTNLWWKPDGTLWAQPPVKMGPLPVLRESAPENEYLFYIRWSLPQGLSHGSWKLQFMPATLTDSAIRAEEKQIKTLATVVFTERPDGFDMVELFRFDEVPARVDGHVQMSFAPWEEVCVYDLDTGATKGPVPAAIRRVGHSRYDKTVKALRFDLTYEVCREQHDLRLVAKLRDGRSKHMLFHPGHEPGQPAVGAVMSPGTEADAGKLALNIKEFILARSPWVRGTISNIAMKPTGN